MPLNHTALAALLICSLPLAMMACSSDDDAATDIGNSVDTGDVTDPDVTDDTGDAGDAPDTVDTSDDATDAGDVADTADVSDTTVDVADAADAADAAADVSDTTDTAVDAADATDTGNPLPTELKAFPTAFGAGATVTGGRGGQVVPVTRLDDALDDVGEPVEGTFRYALTRRFPRTVVFRVSGTIVIGDRDGDGTVDGERFSLLALESEDFSDLTVAGQTAPEGGITIRGAIYIYGLHNQIWRYVRIRHPSEDEVASFAAFTSRDGSGIIMDHVSSAYGGQQAISITNFAGGPDQEAATLQFSLLALAKNGTIMGAADGTGGTTSVHNNMYTHLSHRVPNLAGFESYEVINNLTYDWQWRLLNVHNALTLNHIGNAYIAGPHTQHNLVNQGHKVHLGTDATLDARIYTADNFISFAPDAAEWDAWGVFTEDGTPAPSEMQVFEAFERHPHPVPIRSTDRIIEALPSEVGAFRTLDENGNIVEYRDAIDELVLREFANGESSLYGSSGFTYPAIPSSTPYPDSDADGMPDAWETAHGFDPNVADDAGDADADGYTNLEEFLNEVDRATVYD